jgi:hypothetical protein
MLLKKLGYEHGRATIESGKRVFESILRGDSSLNRSCSFGPFKWFFNSIGHPETIRACWLDIRLPAESRSQLGSGG